MPYLDSWDIIMLDSEAAQKEECKATELEQLQMTVTRYDEERKLMLDEITQLKEMLKREVAQAETEKKTNASIINEYKLIRQRLDSQLNAAKAELDLLKVIIAFYSFNSFSFNLIYRYSRRYRNAKSVKNT